jgi:SAM-dependent methyltransferase
LNYVGDCWMSQLYDSIGIRYHVNRRPDPRFRALIHRQLGAAEFVLNVGAGSGSYEPAGRRVIAVEPSALMARQRLPQAAFCIRADAERLPFVDQSFDASLALLTVHHWANPSLGLEELRRVTRQRIVILTWDPGAVIDFWLTRDYLPDVACLDRRRFPPMSFFKEKLGRTSIIQLDVPFDCEDGFLGAFWRRPEFYLAPEIRKSMSVFSELDDSMVDRALLRLHKDLQNGSWHQRNKTILGLTALDLGYRLVVGTVQSCRSAAGSLGTMI